MKTILLFIALSSIHFISYAQNIGIGTTTPDSKLHVTANATDSVALKISVSNNTKLKLAANGGLSVGTGETPPTDGMLVKGKIITRDTIQAAKAIVITSVSDSVVLRAGNTTIVLLASGAVKITAGGTGGITIDGGNGDVTLKGANVNINAVNNTNITASNVVSLNGTSGGTFQTGGTLTLKGTTGAALTSNTNLTLTGTANATLSAGSGMNINGGVTNISGAATTNINGGITSVQSAGLLNLTGVQVRLGNGSGSFLPAARIGDSVICPPGGGQGAITGGSNIVLIQ